MGRLSPFQPSVILSLRRLNHRRERRHSSRDSIPSQSSRLLHSMICACSDYSLSLVEVSITFVCMACVLVCTTNTYEHMFSSIYL